MLSVLDFGIPNSSHPFTYHMDEWHQLMAVRGLFKYGSPNIEGAAHGPVFFFFLSGIFLGPFYLLRLVDPFVIKSSVSQLVMQQRLFEVLRLSSLVFGIASISLVWQICRQYLKIPPLLPTLFFTITPVWIMLSNYFKYDIALMFFILLSIYTLFWFGKYPTRKRFFITAIMIGAALAIKISALPLVLSFFLAYLLFMPKNKKRVRDTIYGAGIIGATFFIIGIPDSIFYFRQYYDFFYYNIIFNPSETSQYILPWPVWVYMPFHIYPLIFGIGLFSLFFIGFCYYLYFFRIKLNRNANKFLYFLFLIMLFFMASLVPLQIQATGNRALVLLPFIAIFSASFLYSLYNKYFHIRTIGIGLVVCILQAVFVYGWMQMKINSNPREQASVWMKQSLPKQVIGLENIPIYQQIPDLALYEFYTLQENNKTKTFFDYEVIDEKTKKLPKIIIITNIDYELTRVKKSSKKLLLSRMQKEGYKEIMRFNPSGDIYTHFATFEDISLSGLIPIVPISIYQK